MILTERDWFTADAKIRQLKSRIDYMRRRVADPRQALACRLEVERMEKRIDELLAHMAEYSKLAARRRSAAVPLTLSEIPLSLIERRIRSGLSQTELSRRAGTSRQTIVRYEQTNYCAASLSRILQIEAILLELENEIRATVPCKLAGETLPERQENDRAARSL